MRRETLQDWLRLIRLPGLGPVAIGRLLQHFGKPESILEAEKSSLNQVPGISQAMVASLQGFREMIPKDPITNQLDQLANFGGRAIIRGDAEYPQILTEIHDPPPVLFILGDSSHLNSTQSIAIVGSRRASRSGVAFAQNLGRDLSQHNITTVSGLAMGIDTAAHEGALLGNGPTIAVIATGLDVDYPPQNRELKKKIINNGCLITEAPLGTKAVPYLFPPRNRIISGLCQGVVVVEATPRSGSLITARLALEQNREVFAVPGSGAAGDSRSKGVNNLIRQGARLVEDVEDILQELSWSISTKPPTTSSPAKKEQIKNLTTSSKPSKNGSIVDHLADGPLLADELARKCQLTVASLSRILLQLELTGVVVRLSGNRYALLKSQQG
ncbi:MAG: DNA-protecting protein DprA [Magnetococcales bacterium]|nr:DNA-protecting protein DprA [Magnetococcales bacterium]